MEAVIPMCPRCGYDLSGHAQARDPSAETGLCNECGLPFAWADVLDARRADVPGFVEHVPRPRILLAAWKTWAWTVAPGKFWRRVRLEARVSPRRWGAWVLSVFVLPKVAVLVLCITASLMYHITSRTARAGPAEQVLYDGCTALGSGVARIRIVRDYTYTRTGNRWSASPAGYSCSAELADLPPRWSFAPLLWLVPPAMLLLLPHTRRIAKVRAAHVWRAAVYSLSPLAVFSLLDLINAGFVAMRTIAVSAGSARAGSRFAAEVTDPHFPLVWHQGLEAFWMVPLLLVAAWLSCWWWRAIRSYRLPREAQVLTALAAAWAVVIAILFAPPIAYWVYVNYLWQYI